ncbi:MAG: response regulator [Candidatus Hydrogenedentes bacterium]|nr:response regulator [Candidatus Hydrogenedentota bacterium]
MREVPKILRVIVVDDAEMDREAVRRFVQREDLPYELVMLESCRAALEYIQQNRADVALLDYSLNDGTGLDLLPYFQEVSVPVVFVTGNGSEQIAVEALRQGAADYLIKDTERNYLHMMASTVGRVIAHQWMISERDRLLRELQKAVDTLIPTCGRCRKIRDDQDYWEGVERFIAEQSFNFSTYGLCPACTQKTEEETLGLR